MDKADGAARTVLILGGSAEGYALAERLDGAEGVRVVTSFAGATRARRPPAGAFRVGGFGGPEGMAAYLAAERVAALIDATHPFARAISASAALACVRAGVPMVHVVRPPWTPGPGDAWIEADSMEAAAEAIPEGASPCFLTVGRTELADFAGRRDIRFLARMIDPPDETGIAALDLVFARGPFALEDERAFLADHGVRCLVTKNSGGVAAAPKLAAARERAVPVVMVRRPPPPEGERRDGVEGALAWLGETLALDGVGAAR